MTGREPTPAPGEDLSVALALVNTRVSGSRGVFDRLQGADAAAGWMQRHRLAKTKRQDAQAQADLLQLRTDARAVFEAVEQHAIPSGDVLDRVNAAASEPVHPVLRTTDDGLQLWWAPIATAEPTAAVARDLVRFATSESAGRLRTCAADDCDRMFVQDHGRRIWCSPGCGNRMRVQRHARKKRAAAAHAESV